MKPRSSILRRATCIASLVALSIPGCMWAPDLARVSEELERQIPGADFDKKIVLSLGPVSLTFARIVTRLVPEARVARSYLDGVSRVQVAVYDTHAPETSSLHTPERLQQLLGEGWEMAVKARDGEDTVWVLYRIEDDSVRELFVVAMDTEDLVLVKVKGHLEKTIGRALEELGDKNLPSRRSATF